jgi:hypothetical protein
MHAILLAAIVSTQPFAGYMNHAELTAAAHAMAEAHAACTVDVIGASRSGHGLLLITLAAAPDRADEQPALLITAGLDGRHLVGTETAVRVAQRLLSDYPALIEECTVYVLPRMNPDAAEANLSPVVTGHVGTFRVVDEDHDGAADEDGPVDLNGDGVITMMRRANPPLDDEATHGADAAEPRLLVKANAAKGETADYAVYTEGVDADGDGRIAEDPSGMVDLDRNFMHRWPEHEAGAGPYQLSEPESAALATFVLDHPNIVAALTFGRHDNLQGLRGDHGAVAGAEGGHRRVVRLLAVRAARYPELRHRGLGSTGRIRAGASGGRDASRR